MSLDSWGKNIPYRAMQTHSITSEIKEHADKLGIAPATLTSRAVQNSRLYRHLEMGGDCTTRTIDRIRQWIADHPASEEQARAS